MGDPRKQKKKYSTPSHPWQKARIVEEIEQMKEYGLKNKKEIWKMHSMLRKFARQAKKIPTLPAHQIEHEKKRVLDKIKSIGLIKSDADIGSALGITLKDIMERRLQTVVFRKGLARTISQARQFITHKHISVGGKAITSPAYIVKDSERESVEFIKESSLFDAAHPEREIKAKPADGKAEQKASEAKKRKKEYARKGQGKERGFKKQKREPKKQAK